MMDGDRDGPSPEVDADTQSAITTLFLLEQQLNAARSLPGRDVVLQGQLVAVAPHGEL